MLPPIDKEKNYPGKRESLLHLAHRRSDQEREHLTCLVLADVSMKGIP